MSRTTFQNTLSELFGLLADDDGNPVASLSTAGCKKVYPFEPRAKGVAKPCAVTISPSGIEPTDWAIALRVYVADTTPEAAQDLLINVPVAIDALLADGDGYGPSRWLMEWDAEIACDVALCELMVGREDGF